MLRIQHYPRDSRRSKPLNQVMPTCEVWDEDSDVSYAMDFSFDRFTGRVQIVSEARMGDELLRADVVSYHAFHHMRLRATTETYHSLSIGEFYPSGGPSYATGGVLPKEPPNGEVPVILERGRLTS